MIHGGCWSVTFRFVGAFGVCAQKDGRRGAGAGVTGREGRSMAVGKSVSFMDGRRRVGSEGEKGGDFMASVAEETTAASPEGGTFDIVEDCKRENLGFRCCCCARR